MEQIESSGSGRGGALVGSSSSNSLLEELLPSVLEVASESLGHSLQVLHSADALSSSSLGLLGPVETTHLFGRVSTRRAPLLLNVITPLSTPSARHVHLLVPLTKTSGTFRHCQSKP